MNYVFLLSALAFILPPSSGEPTEELVLFKSQELPCHSKDPGGTRKRFQSKFAEVFPLSCVQLVEMDSRLGGLSSLVVSGDGRHFLGVQDDGNFLQGEFYFGGEQMRSNSSSQSSNVQARNGVLGGVKSLQIYPMVDRFGEALSVKGKEHGDAEAVAIASSDGLSFSESLSKGSIIVAFESEPRVSLFEGLKDREKNLQAVGELIGRCKGNQGIESMAVVSMEEDASLKGSSRFLVLICEGFDDGSWGRFPAWFVNLQSLLGRGPHGKDEEQSPRLEKNVDYFPFFLADDSQGFRMTDLSVLPDQTGVAISRKYDPKAPEGAQRNARLEWLDFPSMFSSILQRVAGVEAPPSEFVLGEFRHILYEFDETDGWLLDNMEGIDYWEPQKQIGLGGGEGERYILRDGEQVKDGFTFRNSKRFRFYLVSDDNFDRDEQKMIFINFDILLNYDKLREVRSIVLNSMTKKNQKACREEIRQVVSEGGLSVQQVLLGALLEGAVRGRPLLKAALEEEARALWEGDRARAPALVLKALEYAVEWSGDSLLSSGSSGKKVKSRSSVCEEAFGWLKEGGVEEGLQIAVGLAMIRSPNMGTRTEGYKVCKKLLLAVISSKNAAPSLPDGVLLDLLVQLKSGAFKEVLSIGETRRIISTFLSTFPSRESCSPLLNLWLKEFYGGPFSRRNGESIGGRMEDLLETCRPDFREVGTQPSELAGILEDFGWDTVSDPASVDQILLENFLRRLQQSDGADDFQLLCMEKEDLAKCLVFVLKNFQTKEENLTRKQRVYTHAFKKYFCSLFAPLVTGQEVDWVAHYVPMYDDLNHHEEAGETVQTQQKLTAGEALEEALHQFMQRVSLYMTHSGVRFPLEAVIELVVHSEDEALSCPEQVISLVKLWNGLKKGRYFPKEFQLGMTNGRSQLNVLKMIAEGVLHGKVEPLLPDINFARVEERGKLGKAIGEVPTCWRRKDFLKRIFSLETSEVALEAESFIFDEQKGVFTHHPEVLFVSAVRLFLETEEANPKDPLLQSDFLSRIINQGVEAMVKATCSSEESSLWTSVFDLLAEELNVSVLSNICLHILRSSSSIPSILRLLTKVPGGGGVELVSRYLYSCDSSEAVQTALYLVLSETSLGLPWLEKETQCARDCEEIMDFVKSFFPKVSTSPVTTFSDYLSDIDKATVAGLLPLLGSCLDRLAELAEEEEDQEEAEYVEECKSHLHAMHEQALLNYPHIFGALEKEKTALSPEILTHYEDVPASSQLNSLKSKPDARKEEVEPPSLPRIFPMGIDDFPPLSSLPARELRSPELPRQRKSKDSNGQRPPPSLPLQPSALGQPQPVEEVRATEGMDLAELEEAKMLFRLFVGGVVSPSDLHSELSSAGSSKLASSLCRLLVSELPEWRSLSFSSPESLLLRAELLKELWMGGTLEVIPVQEKAHFLAEVGEFCVACVRERPDSLLFLVGVRTLEEVARTGRVLEVVEQLHLLFTEASFLSPCPNLRNNLLAQMQGEFVRPYEPFPYLPGEQELMHRVQQKRNMVQRDARSLSPEKMNASRGNSYFLPPAPPSVLPPTLMEANIDMGSPHYPVRALPPGLHADPESRSPFLPPGLEGDAPLGLLEADSADLIPKLLAQMNLVPEMDRGQEPVMEYRQSVPGSLAHLAHPDINGERRSGCSQPSPFAEAREGLERRAQPMPMSPRTSEHPTFNVLGSSVDIFGAVGSSVGLTGLREGQEHGVLREQSNVLECLDSYLLQSPEISPARNFLLDPAENVPSQPSSPEHSGWNPFGTLQTQGKGLYPWDDDMWGQNHRKH